MKSEQEKFGKRYNLITSNHMLANPQHVKWICQDLIAEGSVNLLSAPTNVGKSFFRMNLALSLAQGLPFLDFIPNEPCPCVTIDSENGIILEGERYSAMLKGVNSTGSIPHDWIPFDGQSLGDSKCQDLFAGLFRQGYKVIFLDALSSFLSGSENDNLEMRKQIDFLQGLACEHSGAFFINHHFRKPSKGDISGSGASIRGASAIEGTVSNSFLLVRQDKQLSEFRLEYSKLRAAPMRSGRTIIFEFPWFRKASIVEVMKSPESAVNAVCYFTGGDPSAAELQDKIMELRGCGRATAKDAMQSALNEKKLHTYRIGRSKKYSRLTDMERALGVS